MTYPLMGDPVADYCRIVVVVWALDDSGEEFSPALEDENEGFAPSLKTALRASLKIVEALKSLLVKKR